LNTTSLKYLSLDGMLRAAGKKPDDFCSACFTTKYPIEITDGGRVQ
jgi:amidophosphoribosyltransferase